MEVCVFPFHLFKMAKRTSNVLGFAGNDAKRNPIQEVSELDSVKQSIGLKFSNDSASGSPEQSEPPAKSIEGNDSIEKPEPPGADSTKENPEVITVDASVLQKLLDNAVAQAVEPIKAENEKLKSEAEAKDTAISETTKKLETSEDSAKKLAELFSLRGSQSTSEDKASDKPVDKFPMLNTKYGTDSGLKGAARDFVGMLESDQYTPAKAVLDSQGSILVQRDYRELTKFWKANKDAVRGDMELFAKRHGLLQGWKAKDFNADAATLKADIPSAFLVYLSMVLRETHTPSFIFWQFCYERLELGKQAGDSIQVPRFNYLPTATSAASRRLTPGNPIGSTRQPLTMTTVSLQLEELGLNEPVAIPEFVHAYSQVELEGVLQSRLGYDYEFYNDMRIRAEFLATTRVLYPKKNTVADAPGQLAAGDICQMTEGFLNALFAYMRGLQIPTYDNGKYALVLHTNALKQLGDDLLSRKQFMTKSNLEDITNILNAATAGEMGVVSGYIGDMCNFMIFETNIFGLGAAGTEAAQNETIAGSSRLTRASLAFGRNAVAKATGMAAEVRRDEVRDFGRMDSYTWLSHATYGPLDVDPAINANQQLRVVEVRTVDAPL